MTHLQSIHRRSWPKESFFVLEATNVPPGFGVQGQGIRRQRNGGRHTKRFTSQNVLSNTDVQQKSPDWTSRETQRAEPDTTSDVHQHLSVQALDLSPVSSESQKQLFSEENIRARKLKKVKSLQDISNNPSDAQAGNLTSRDAFTQTQTPDRNKNIPHVEGSTAEQQTAPTQSPRVDSAHKHHESVYSTHHYDGYLHTHGSIDSMLTSRSRFSSKALSNLHRLAVLQTLKLKSPLVHPLALQTTLDAGIHPISAYHYPYKIITPVLNLQENPKRQTNCQPVKKISCQRVSETPTVGTLTHDKKIPLYPLEFGPLTNSEPRDESYSIKVPQKTGDNGHLGLYRSFPLHQDFSGTEVLSKYPASHLTGRLDSASSTMRLRLADAHVRRDHSIRKPIHDRTQHVPYIFGGELKTTSSSHPYDAVIEKILRRNQRQVNDLYDLDLTHFLHDKAVFGADSNDTNGNINEIYTNVGPVKILTQPAMKNSSVAGYQHIAHNNTCDCGGDEYSCVNPLSTNTMEAAPTNTWTDQSGNDRELPQDETEPVKDSEGFCSDIGGEKASGTTVDVTLQWRCEETQKQTYEQTYEQRGDVTLTETPASLPGHQQLSTPDTSIPKAGDDLSLHVNTSTKSDTFASFTSNSTTVSSVGEEIKTNRLGTETALDDNRTERGITSNSEVSRSKSLSVSEKNADEGGRNSEPNNAYIRNNSNDKRNLESLTSQHRREFSSKNNSNIIEKSEPSTDNSHKQQRLSSPGNRSTANRNDNRRWSVSNLPGKTTSESRPESRGEWIVCRDYRTAASQATDYGGKHNVWTRDNAAHTQHRDKGSGDSVEKCGRRGKMIVDNDSSTAHQHLQETGSERTKACSLSNQNNLSGVNTETTQSQMSTRKFSGNDDIMLSSRADRLSLDYGKHNQTASLSKRHSASSESLLVSKLSWRISELSRNKSQTKTDKRSVGNRLVTKETPRNRPLTRESVFRSRPQSVDGRPRNHPSTSYFSHGLSRGFYTDRSPAFEQSRKQYVAEHLQIHRPITREECLDTPLNRQRGLEMNRSNGTRYAKLQITKKDAARFVQDVDTLQCIQTGDPNPAPHDSEATQDLLDYFWSYQGMGRQILGVKSMDGRVDQGRELSNCSSFDSLRPLPPIDCARTQSAVVGDNEAAAFPTVSHPTFPSGAEPGEDRQEAARRKIQLVVKLPQFGMEGDGEVGEEEE